MTDLGARTEKSKLLRTHCQTSGVSLTEQDPYNNIVRTTIEALAAVLGGTQSLHTNSFDEAIALPTDFSARIARNTQLILAEESGVTAVADPLGGSWYVEALTRELEEKAWALIQEVEALGGMTKAVTEGLPKRRIEEAAAAAPVQGRYRRSGDRRGQPLSAGGRGRARHPRSRQCQGPRRPDRAAAAHPRRPVTRRRCKRRCRPWRKAPVRTPTSLRLSVEAARARATLGEISDALERVFGRYATKPEPVSGIYGQRADQRWEEAKQGTVAVGQRLGRKPRMLVAKMGQDGHDRGANLVSSAFGDLGFRDRRRARCSRPRAKRPNWR